MIKEARSCEFTDCKFNLLLVIDAGKNYDLTYQVNISKNMMICLACSKFKGGDFYQPREEK